MGSFNTTCFASQQTIVPQAECFIFPIMQQATYSEIEITDQKDNTFEKWGVAHTTCYPDCFWDYAGPIIKGTYYDYGQFKLSEDEQNIQALITLFNDLEHRCYQTKQGENKYHDIAFNFRELYQSKNTYNFEQLEDIWNKLQVAIDKNRVFLSDYNGQPRQFQIAVMHKSTADYLSTMIEQKSNYKKQSYVKKEYFKYYITESLKNIMVAVENSTRKLNNEFIYSLLMMKVSSLEDFNVGSNTHLSNVYDNYAQINQIFESFKDQIINKQLSDEFIEALMNALQLQIDHLYVHAGLDTLNVKVTPMVYADQDYSNEIGKDYLKMIKAVNKQIKQEIKQKYDE